MRVSLRCRAIQLHRNTLKRETNLLLKWYLWTALALLPSKGHNFDGKIIFFMFVLNDVTDHVGYTHCNCLSLFQMLEYSEEVGLSVAYQGTYHNCHRGKSCLKDVVAAVQHNYANVTVMNLGQTLLMEFQDFK